MTTFREELDRAAFWDGWVCLLCLSTADDQECPECADGGEMVRATSLQRFLEHPGTNDPNGEAETKL